jgi:hypothetical protein
MLSSILPPLFFKKPKDNKTVRIHVEEKPVNPNWKKIGFWVRHYDIAENFKKMGNHKTHLAKQDPTGFIELACGFALKTIIPLNGKGLHQLRRHTYVNELITIYELFEFWQIDETIKISFKRWLDDIVFAEYVNKQSVLMSEIKPLKFYAQKERQQFHLTIKNEKIYQGSEPFDTQNKFFIFVQDAEGNFYASQTVIDKYDYVRHSSLLQCERVKSAGVISVHDGKINVLLNLSGHYKPDLRQIYDAVALLANKRVFAKEAKIIYFKEVYDFDLDAINMENREFSIPEFLEQAKTAALEIRKPMEKANSTIPRIKI